MSNKISQRNVCKTQIFPIHSILQPIFILFNRYIAESLAIFCSKFSNTLNYPSKKAKHPYLSATYKFHLSFMSSFISVVSQMSSLGSVVLQLLISISNTCVASNKCVPSLSNESTFHTQLWYHKHLFRLNGFLMLSKPSCWRKIYLLSCLHDLKKNYFR